MPRFLKLMLKYCCFFFFFFVCVMPKIYVPHLSCMFYALQVITAHLNMLPRGLKKSLDYSLPDWLSGVALLAFSREMSP